MEYRKNRILNIEYRIRKKELSIPGFSFSIFDIRHSIFHQRGFSLLELLIVVALMSILLAGGSGFYRGFGKNVELTSTSQTIAADLRQMQAKAMIGDSGYKWGARFVKNTSGSDYYLLLSTDGTNSTTTATTTLSSGITFSDPSSGYKDIIFNKISGTIATATTTSIRLEGTTATTTVSTTGAIY